MPYHQINSIPTPLLCWTALGGNPVVIDSGDVSFLLSRVFIGTPVNPPTQADLANAGFSMSAALVHNTAFSSGEDFAAASFSLVAAVIAGPVSASAADSGNAGFAMSGVAIFSEISTSASDSANAGFAMIGAP